MATTLTSIDESAEYGPNLIPRTIPLHITGFVEGGSLIYYVDESLIPKNSIIKTCIQNINTLVQEPIIIKILPMIGNPNIGSDELPSMMLNKEILNKFFQIASFVSSNIETFTPTPIPIPIYTHTHYKEQFASYINIDIGIAKNDPNMIKLFIIFADYIEDTMTLDALCTYFADHMTKYL